jgi:hypothetical protein
MARTELSLGSSDPEINDRPLIFTAAAAGLLVIAVIAATAVGGRGGVPASAAGAPAASPPSAPSASPSNAPTGVAAIEAVIQKANDEQQRAFAQNDPTLMRDTATAAYYAELVRMDAALRSGGVTAIQLVAITFDQASVQGGAAQVSTMETWRATFADGTTADDTTVNTYTLVLTAGTWLISADTQPSTNVPPGATPGGMPATVGATSRNWSGYVASGGTFTAVSGSWTVPTVSPTAPAIGADATWVGIGGATSRDLIQAGTQAVVGNGAVQYSAWIETLPQASQPVSLAVAAGDTVSVSIVEGSSGTWTITITNATTGGVYSGTVTYASSASSAEWIQEAPSTGKGVVLLDRFGAIRFTNASTVVNGQTLTPAAANATAVTMVNAKAGITLSTPSPLGSDGASFTVTRG